MRNKKNAAIFIVLNLMTAGWAHADISALILDGEGTSRWITGAGHTAVYLSNICADEPNKLRLCKEGEHGVVINRMPHMSAENFDWMATPADVFFSGASSPEHAPIIATKKITTAVVQQQFNEYESKDVAKNADGTMPTGRWQKTIDALSSRTIYEYRVKDTLDDEVKIMNTLNQGSNVSHYNLVFNNCADFVNSALKVVLGRSVGKDLNGLEFMRQPKSIAMDLSGMEKKDPGIELQIIKHVQTPGDSLRSAEVKFPLENDYENPLWLGISAMWAPHFLLGTFVFHRLLRPYDLDRAYRKQMDQETLSETFGDKKDWKDYQNRFRSIIEAASHDPSIPEDLREILTKSRGGQGLSKALMKYFDKNGDFSVQDQNVSMKLQIPGEAKPRTAGLTRESVLQGDRALGFLVMASEIDQNLYDGQRVRTSMPEFKKDWDLLESLEPHSMLGDCSQGNTGFADASDLSKLKDGLEDIGSRAAQVIDFVAH